MTGLNELLDQAAGDEDVGFDARDVCRRVRRRRRLRRTIVAVSTVVVLAGAGIVGIAHATGDGDGGRVETAGTLDTAAADLVGLWRPVAYSAVVVPPEGVRLEFLADGTFQGDDGCNTFGGDWSLDDSRLVVSELRSTLQLCNGQDDTGLQDILAGDPTVAESEVGAGAIELRSGGDWVAFERVEVDDVGPADCPERVPNSPSTFDPSGGTYAAHLLAVDPDSASVSFDVVQWLSGDAAIDRYRQDTPDDPGGTPPNEYWLVNDSDQVRAARFADAAIRLPEARVPGDALNTPATADELADYVSEHDGDVFWLTFQDDQIVEVCRQYRP